MGTFELRIEFCIQKYAYLSVLAKFFKNGGFFLWRTAFSKLKICVFSRFQNVFWGKKWRWFWIQGPFCLNLRSFLANPQKVTFESFEAWYLKNGKRYAKTDYIFGISTKIWVRKSVKNLIYKEFWILTIFTVLVKFGSNMEKTEYVRK